MEQYQWHVWSEAVTWRRNDLRGSMTWEKQGIEQCSVPTWKGTYVGFRGIRYLEESTRHWSWWFPCRGKNWISIRTQGKKRNYILHFGILGDVWVLPVTLMESSLTVCEEKILGRKTPVVLNLDGRYQYELMILLRKTSLKEWNSEITEWGDFYLSLEFLEW